MINNSLVVVSAHVIKQHEPFEPSQIHYSVKRVIVHEEFGRAHDIMLLQLNASIEFNEYARPICVDDSMFTPGTTCMITGWSSSHNWGKNTSTHTHFTLFTRGSWPCELAV